MLGPVSRMLGLQREPRIEAPLPEAVSEASIQRTARLRAAAALRFVPRADHAIVVFGSPALDDGTPKPPLLRRLERTLAEARRHPEALIVASGAAVQGAMPEAQAMKRWLVSKGIEARRIVLESGARFTLENAELSAALVKTSGASRTTLVTEKFHLARSRALLAAALAAIGSRSTVDVAPALDAPGRTSHGGEDEKLARDLLTQRRLHATSQARREWIA